MSKQDTRASLEVSAEDERATAAEVFAWCEAHGLTPAVKAIAKRKPRNSKRQEALISRVMKRERA